MAGMRMVFIFGSARNVLQWFGGQTLTRASAGFGGMMPRKVREGKGALFSEEYETETVISTCHAQQPSVAVLRQDVRPHKLESRFHMILAIACTVVVRVAVATPALAIDQIRRDVVAAGIGCRLTDGFNDPAIRRGFVGDFCGLGGFVGCDSKQSWIGHGMGCDASRV